VNIGDIGQMNIHLINLDKDADRLDWMTRQLADRGLAFRRQRGIAPAAGLTAEQRRFATDPKRSGLRPGEVGTLLSHMSVWQTIAVGDAPFGLVLEDDLHLAPDFGDFVRQIRLDPSEICVHRFETFLPRVTLARRPQFRCGARSAHRLYTNHGGAGAYATNRDTARYLLDRAGSVSHAVDVELFDPERRALKDLVVYQWMPAPCIQDMHLCDARKLDLQSNNVERQDIDTGVLRADDTGTLRDWLRPAYTRLYDMMLMPSGKARRLVRFG